ncbi:hypothetical protein BJ165DRAFT_1404752 [Panaeolus papilionaceus]|nr:hypothetical protein BJ165DRAFT_1404752 [Panaeolus papilionaceus]
MYPLYATLAQAQALEHSTFYSNSQESNNHDNGDNSVTRFGTALPPTFFDTSIATTIQYEVYLQISHGRFRPDTRMATGITYLPTVTPPPIPRSRGIIYKVISGRGARDDCRSVVTPSPLSDPAGWMKCTSAILTGTMGDLSKPIKVGC